MSNTNAQTFFYDQLPSLLDFFAENDDLAAVTVGRYKEIWQLRAAEMGVENPQEVAEYAATRYEQDVPANLRKDGEDETVFVERAEVEMAMTFLSEAFYARSLPAFLVFLKQSRPEAMCAHEYSDLWERYARKIIEPTGDTPMKVALNERLYTAIGDYAVSRWETDIPEEYRTECTPLPDELKALLAILAMGDSD